MENAKTSKFNITTKPLVPTLLVRRAWSTANEKYMRAALDLAEKALLCDETPIGCIFVCNGEIIGQGINDTNRSMNGTRHAEFIAISAILQKHPITIFRETELYVTVEPCVMCASALRQLGIKKAWFGCANDRFGGTGGVFTIHSE